jgi:Mlc titration factor MtfA (ptsG expression regulator)
MVSTTIASVILLLGNDTDPETCKLVEVAEDIMAEPRLVRLDTYKLVEVMPLTVALVAPRVVKKPLVEVTLVPVAVVNPNAPDNVPPVKSR